MSWPKVMVTGHRPQQLTVEQQDFAQVELGRLAVKLRKNHGTEVAISGMALGADQWWAHHALAAGLELWSFIPFPTQDARWHHTDQRRWRELRARAAKEMVIAQEYSVQALHERNDTMLSFADAVIAVWDPRRTRGGTASCVEKARSRRFPIILVNLETLTTTYQEPLS